MPSVGTEPIRIFKADRIYIEDYARKKSLSMHQALKELLQAKSLDPLIQQSPPEKIEKVVNREKRIYGCCICEFESDRPQETNAHQLSEHINPYIEKKKGIKIEGNLQRRI
ncbi:MAG: hypothetical protein ACYS1A_16655 [Planctomycetota bacterium]|jgi:hypothetical protein